MARKERRPKKKFWSKRKITVCLIVVGLFIVANAIALNHPTLPRPTGGIPIYEAAPDSPIPTGNFSINQTAAMQFVNYTLGDYTSMLAEHQGRWANFTSVQHFFDLYRPSGSWLVQVGSDNGTNFPNYIEFIFRFSPSASPRTVVYTNQTGASLRPAMATNLSANDITINYHNTDYGIILTQYYVQSAVNTTLIPLIWITNSTEVYGDVSVNANNAALAIYQYDVQAMHLELYPYYPHWGWFQNEWRWYGGDIEFFGLLFGIFTGVIYLQREGYLQFKRSSGTEQEPQTEQRQS